MRNPASLCDASDALLAVIDIQSRLLPAMAEDDQRRVVDHAGRLLRAADMLDLPVLITEQYPRGLGHTDTRLAGLAPAAAQTLEKTSFSACGAEAFLRCIDYSGRNQVVLLGMEAHVCVLQTALDLLARGLEVFLVADAVCSRDAAHRENAIARMRGAGAVISNRESVMFEWLRDARHEKFRDISRQLIA